MDKIEIKVLNPAALEDVETMAVAMARLTQHSEKISCMRDFEELMAKPFSQKFVENLAALPHPTLQKFGVVNIAIVGASRRFLGQITRHQNEVKFMSGSLQYSDYTDKAQFCIPYEILRLDAEESEQYGTPCKYASNAYLTSCFESLDTYERLAARVGNDAAGYVMPQGMRNVLVISALPFQWKHMISQRTCNRNTLETQYVMLRCWEELAALSPMFTECGPFCAAGNCKEGAMSCGRPFILKTPSELLDSSFPLLRKV